MDAHRLFKVTSFNQILIDSLLTSSILFTWLWISELLLCSEVNSLTMSWWSSISDAYWLISLIPECDSESFTPILNVYFSCVYSTWNIVVFLSTIGSNTKCVIISFIVLIKL